MQRHLEGLLSYRDCGDDDKQSGGLTNLNGLMPSRNYDETIAVKTQYNSHYYRNEGTTKNDGVIDYSLVKKTKTILVVDDDQDTTLTVKVGLEIENNRSTNRIHFQVYTYNFPLLALSEFKPNFYDLLLVDVEMPEINGFEFSAKILKIDSNPKICFMSAAEVNYEALREIYPSVSVGCFIKKPVLLEHLVRRIKDELE